MKHREHELTSNNTLASATALGSSVAGVATALHSLDSSNYVNTPWIREVPGIDHSTSAMGSFFVGLTVVTGADKMASRFEDSGHPRAAEKIRRAGTVAAWIGSAACQLAIETNPSFGTQDKWDIIAGIAATAPGIIAGRGLARNTANNKGSE